MTRWHVERCGCYAAGPFETRAQARAWIHAQPWPWRGFEAVPHQTWNDLLEPVTESDGCARWLAMVALAVGATIAAAWLHMS